ncbi:MAG: autorepressor SdpR family transcription factor [Spirochaetales bacterium]|nr:autorepressor SdpR family transcription factor [Spirochaetales bacterium]
MNLLFKALADPTRRQILEQLRIKDRSAGEIANAFDITKPSVSHHLALLKQAQLVMAHRKGQSIIYSLNTTVFQDLLTWIYTIKDPHSPKKDGEGE